LFRHSQTITVRDIEKLFGLSQRAARNVLTRWVENGFLVIADPAKKRRKYGLASEFQPLI
jgi:Fic family protein